MTNEDLGQELRENNEKIIECILLLRTQRDELAYIIERQYEERRKLETEMERITYKLCLINKSLAQRIKAKTNYDKTLEEMEENYAKLVKDSGELLCAIKTQFENLDSLINKKTSTDDAPPPGLQDVAGSGEQMGEEIKDPCKCRPINKSNQCPPVAEEKPTKLQKPASTEVSKSSVNTVNTSITTSVNTVNRSMMGNSIASDVEQKSPK